LKNFFLTFQRKLTDEDVKKILNDGDANGDNKIELSEFIDIMSKS
jgi:Ca2+-binding EF-hand superfamily protein